jgi:ribose transport system permease protein
MMENEKPGSLTEGPVQLLNRSLLGLSLNRLLTLGVFAAMFAIFSIFANNFFTARSVLNLLVQASPFALLGIGETLVLVVGCIDFSVGAVIALSGTAVLMFARMGMPISLAMIAACMVCGIVGLANGILVARLRLPSFIITFAMAMLIPGFSMALRTFLGAFSDPASPPESLNHIGDLANHPVFAIYSQDANGAESVVFPGISWIVIIMVVVAMLSHLLLTKTRFGRHAFLIGSNQTASLLSGIKVVRIKTLAFVLSSMLAGLTGVLLASRMGGAPGGAVGYEMIAIACAMLGGASLSGGVGSVGGAVLGSFFLTTLAMGLTMMGANQISLPTLLNGLILLVVVYLDQIRNRK